MAILQNIAKDGHLVYSPKPPEGVTEKMCICAQYTSVGIEPACYFWLSR